MTACVTGATGFVGAHVARLLTERGDDVRATYRDKTRLRSLHGTACKGVKADILDFKAMRRAVRGCDVLFHTAGFVGSSPADEVWRVNAEGPVVAVEAAAAEGVPRVVLTSTISTIGPAHDDRPADERQPYPDERLGLTYPDSKHDGERGALDAGDRHGVEVVVVNPAYVLGVPVDPEQPGETSTRIVGNYLRGRLPAVVDAPMNFVDVSDAAEGHLLAAERGRPGERYILGGDHLRWPELIDHVADLSGVHHPIGVLPREVTRVGRLREALGLPGPVSSEALELMGQEWRFTSGKAESEIGYRPRPLSVTLAATVAWYQDLIRAGVLDGGRRSPLSVIAAATRTASKLGLLLPVRATQRIAGRRFLAGL
jgi:dihydroflavonol-4-reductase